MRVSESQRSISSRIVFADDGIMLLIHSSGICAVFGVDVLVWFSDAGIVVKMEGKLLLNRRELLLFDCIY